AVGLGGHIIVHVLARTFYAMQDTKTPVKWAIVAVAINVPLMAWLVGPMGIEGLALAMSIAAVIEVLGLLWSLHRRIESVEEAAIVRSLGRAAVAGVAAALFMLGGLTLVEGSLGGFLDNVVGRLLALLVLSAAGGAVYLVVAAALRAPELAQLRDLLRRRTTRRPR
ncbi:MAG TPA: lipid II flippase MurJ, partial [Candidatus Limnocylindria bacterium]|nr:lipid II flippase MurJ [Candidatus Limnocylindria bacterium]